MNIRFQGALPPATIRKKMREVERAAISGASVEELSKLIAPLTVGYITSTSYLSGSFFRARPRKSIHEFRTIKDMWHPPVEKTPQGRVNESGTPVFYCSADHGIATKEMNLEVGDRITILRCLLRTPDRMPHVLSIGALKKNVRTGKNIFERNATGPFDFRQYPHEILDRALLLDAFFARVFTVEDKTYFNLTNAISKFYINSPEIDGLVYPSVKQKGGYNLALKPAAADTLLIPDSIFSARLVQKLNGDRLHMKRDYLGNVRANGSIAWYAAI
jgi:RES domain-containing protein